MENIRKIFNYPVTRLILRGAAKALVIALLASLLFSVFVTYQMYGLTFDKEYHFFGNALEFFVFALTFTVISSILVALFTDISLAFFLRSDVIKNHISYKRSFVAGSLIGGIIGILGAYIMTNQISDKFLYFITFIFSSLAGGFGGLWMTKDAIRLFPQNIR